MAMESRVSMSFRSEHEDTFRRVVCGGLPRPKLSWVFRNGIASECFFPPLHGHGKSSKYVFHEGLPSTGITRSFCGHRRQLPEDGNVGMTQVLHAGCGAASQSRE